MAPYDSDSSDEGDNYTETNVLLGYASTETTGDAISHLGGVPTWIDEQTSPSGVLAKCKVCNGLLSLLLELHGDLPEQFPGHERRLYIWTCRRKTCRRKDGSVRGIRGVRVVQGGKSKTATYVAEVKREEKPQPNIGESLFGVKANLTSTPNNQLPANPFSSKPNYANPFSAPKPLALVESDDKANEASTTLPGTFASKLRLASSPPSHQPPRPHEPWPTESSFPTPYPHYHLDAEYETLDAPSEPQLPQNVSMDVDTDGGGSAPGKEDKDVFESSIDKTFQKFADRIGENADQVLRYEFKGRPMLYNDKDNIGKLLAHHSENTPFSNQKITSTGSKGGAGFPRCQACGAERVFELQLTPHTIVELEVDDMTMDGMEWGTIIMAVCGKDCKPSDVSNGEVGYVEEWIGVQWEEAASKK